MHYWIYWIILGGGGHSLIQMGPPRIEVGPSMEGPEGCFSDLREFGFPRASSFFSPHYFLIVSLSCPYCFPIISLLIPYLFPIISLFFILNHCCLRGSGFLILGWIRMAAATSAAAMLSSSSWNSRRLWKGREKKINRPTIKIRTISQ